MTVMMFCVWKHVDLPDSNKMSLICWSVNVWSPHPPIASSDPFGWCLNSVHVCALSQRSSSPCHKLPQGTCARQQSAHSRNLWYPSRLIRLIYTFLLRGIWPSPIPTPLTECKSSITMCNWSYTTTYATQRKSPTACHNPYNVQNHSITICSL